MVTAHREEANLVAGVLIILMGLFMLGWWSMLARQRDGALDSHSKADVPLPLFWG